MAKSKMEAGIAGWSADRVCKMINCHLGRESETGYGKVTGSYPEMQFYLYLVCFDQACLVISF